MRTPVRKPENSDGGNILAFDKRRGRDLRNEFLRCEQGRLIGSARMSATGMMACSISRDTRHSLSAMYANAAFLGRHGTCVPGLPTRRAKG